MPVNTCTHVDGNWLWKTDNKKNFVDEKMYMLTKLVFSKNFLCCYIWISYWKDNHTLMITYVLRGVGWGCVCACVGVHAYVCTCIRACKLIYIQCICEVWFPVCLFVCVCMQLCVCMCVGWGGDRSLFEVKPFPIRRKTIPYST